MRSTILYTDMPYPGSKIEVPSFARAPYLGTQGDEQRTLQYRGLWRFARFYRSSTTRLGDSTRGLIS